MNRELDFTRGESTILTLLRQREYRIVLACGLALAVLGIVTYGEGVDNWVQAARLFLTGDSMYVPQESPVNPYAQYYPYLPTFALLIAAFGRIFGTDGIVLYGFVKLLAITSFLASGYLVRQLVPQRPTIAHLAYYLFPLSITALLYRESSAVVVLFVLAGLWAADRDHYLLAGTFLALSTFKFLTIPLLGLVPLAAFRHRGVRGAVRSGVGILLGLAPTLGYYALFPDDFELLIAARGGLTHYATRYSGQVLLNPLNGVLDVHFYKLYIFVPLVALTCLVAAGLLLVDRLTLVDASLLIMTPMTFLAPAETRLFVFGTLGLVAFLRRDVPLAELWIALVFAGTAVKQLALTMKGSGLTTSIPYKLGVVVEFYWLDQLSLLVALGGILLLARYGDVAADRT